jgi:hypothetical protein
LVADYEEEAVSLVEALVDTGALELIIQNLTRLAERFVRSYAVRY